ncbi:MAG: helix-turn-helix transcriptional regulator [Cruoricaptor ignavus]|nr:helix-turn-helix transcriptional regulator [Cruoricaptor ignavus]
MTLNERITKIIAYSELSSSEFADAVDVPRSSISHIASGRNKPSLDFLIKVKDRFPELEWDWLIKGKGEMLKSDSTENEIPNEVDKRTTTSLPDLFTLIDDDNFGITESEDRLSKENPREEPVPNKEPVREIISDSQRLEIQENKKAIQHIENQENKIKRIVLFFDNGKFESFEP